jgi:uncharacterized repeat protein (TIGR01451 family)
MPNKNFKHKLIDNASKVNNLNLIKSVKRDYFIKTIKKIIVTSLVFVFVLSGISTINYFIDKNPIKTKAAPAFGSTASNGGDISIDKTYYNGNLESDNISVNEGDTVTVRVKYDNTGNQTVTAVNIKDSIPVGFTYVPGSTKNCLVPTTAETVCDSGNATQKDSLFTALTGTSGTSPTAGLYDAADIGATGTDYGANTGLLEIGKKRYLNLNVCYYYGTDSYVEYTDNGSLTGFVAGTKVSNLTQNLVNCGTGGFGYNYNSSNSGVQNLDLLNKKYFNLNQCSYADTVDSYTNLIDGLPTTNWNAGTNTSNISQTVNNCGIAGYGYGVDSNISALKSMNLIGNRYINLAKCTYYNGSRPHYISAIDNITNSQYAANTSISNTPTTISCGAGQAGHPLESVSTNIQNLDLLDTTRGKGYIEYKMIAPTTVGSFGTNVTLAGIDNIGAKTISDVGSNNQVTVVDNTGIPSTPVVTKINGIPYTPNSAPLISSRTVVIEGTGDPLSYIITGDISNPINDPYTTQNVCQNSVNSPFDSWSGYRQVDASGNWTCTLNINSSDGVFNYHSKASNSLSLGSVGNVNFSFQIDTTPTITKINGQTFIPGLSPSFLPGTVVIEGKAVPNTFVQVTRAQADPYAYGYGCQDFINQSVPGNVAWYSRPVDSNGDWSCTLNNFSIGDYQLYLRDVSLQAQYSGLNFVGNLKIRDYLPNVPVITKINNQNYTFGQTPVITSKHVIVEGLADPGSSIDLRRNDRTTYWFKNPDLTNKVCTNDYSLYNNVVPYNSSPYTIIADAQGKWSCEFDVESDFTTYNGFLFKTDPATNITTPLINYSFRVDSNYGLSSSSSSVSSSLSSSSSSSVVSSSVVSSISSSEAASSSSEISSSTATSSQESSSIQSIESSSTIDSSSSQNSSEATSSLESSSASATIQSSSSTSSAMSSSTASSSENSSSQESSSVVSSSEVSSSVSSSSSTFIPTLGSFIPNAPITGSLGSTFPLINLNGCNLPNNTYAIFVINDGLSNQATIVGTIQSGNFVPNVGSLIPSVTPIGNNVGVIKSSGLTQLTIPTNFISQIISSSSVSSSSSSLIFSSALNFSSVSTTSSLVSSSVIYSSVVSSNNSSSSDISSSIQSSSKTSSSVISSSLSSSSSLATSSLIQSSSRISSSTSSLILSSSSSSILSSSTVTSSSIASISSATSSSVQSSSIGLSSNISSSSSVSSIVSVSSTSSSVTPTLGTFAPSAPITGMVGSPFPNIPLNGNTLPNNTIAQFIVPSTNSSVITINGKIQNNQFVANAGSVIPLSFSIDSIIQYFIPTLIVAIPLSTVTGPSTGILRSAGVPDLIVPTNFTPLSVTTSSSSSSILSLSAISSLASSSSVQSSSLASSIQSSSKTLSSLISSSLSSSSSLATSSLIQSSSIISNSASSLTLSSSSSSILSSSTVTSSSIASISSATSSSVQSSSIGSSSNISSSSSVSSITTLNTNPILGTIGSPFPNITVTGLYIPNGTIANFRQAGSNTIINGTIQNNIFVPDPGQVIPVDAQLGFSFGFLSFPSTPGLTNVSVITNFSTQIPLLQSGNVILISNSSILSSSSQLKQLQNLHPEQSEISLLNNARENSDKIISIIADQAKKVLPAIKIYAEPIIVLARTGGQSFSNNWNWILNLFILLSIVWIKLTKNE